MKSNRLEVTDKKIFNLINLEKKRQLECLEMIPSENYISDAVSGTLGSVLTNKYSEGYANKRYYQGNRYIDEIELLAIERCKKLFGVPHVNVQSYSGSPANSAVYFALLEPNDKIMGLKLSGGGHLTHGHPKVTFSGRFFNSVQFNVEPDGWLDMDKISKLVKSEKPKMLVVGTTAYPRFFDWKKWREIADSVNALLLADVAHVAGLIAGEVYPSPVPFADIVMFTTHKTIRGPRGAVLMVTKRGLKRDKDMGVKIDRAVFPGLSGGPHNNVTAAMAVCFQEAASPKFKKYAQQIVKNAKLLAQILLKNNYKLTTDGTDSHLIVIDLRPKKVIGNIVAEALEVANIVVNYNTVPHDENPPMYPSGVRLGTPILTTRGMKEKEMQKIGMWIVDVINQVEHYRLPERKEERSIFIKSVKTALWKNNKLKKLGQEVKKFAVKYPLFTW
jgi:glycine hydroxymethyltransferase